MNTLGVLHDDHASQSPPPAQHSTRLDCLEVKVVPATVSGTAHLAAELRVETHEVDRWETRLETTRPGSREHAILLKDIARTEARIAVQEARLLARLGRSPFVYARGAVTAALPAAATSLSPAIAGASTTPAANTTATTPATTTVNANTAQSTTTAASSPSTLPANVSQTLDVIYDAYSANPSSFPSGIPAVDGANLVVVQGSNVGIQVDDSNPAEFNTFVSNLQSVGVRITDTSATYGTVVGMVPVSDLPAVAALSDASSVSPLMQPSYK